jgi:hypothetical protein
MPNYPNFWRSSDGEQQIQDRGIRQRRLNLFSTLSGKVTAINPKPQTGPETLSSGPRSEGRLIHIQISDWKEGKNPLAADDCKAYLLKGKSI